MTEKAQDILFAFVAAFFGAASSSASTTFFGRPFAAPLVFAAAVFAAAVLGAGFVSLTLVLALGLTASSAVAAASFVAVLRPDLRFAGMAAAAGSSEAGFLVLIYLIWATVARVSQWCCLMGGGCSSLVMEKSVVEDVFALLRIRHVLVSPGSRVGGSRVKRRLMRVTVQRAELAAVPYGTSSA